MLVLMLLRVDELDELLELLIVDKLVNVVQELLMLVRLVLDEASSSCRPRTKMS